MTCAPKVSVVLPTYNRAHFLLEAVQSVLVQTAGDLELIVVDDGSTDGTAHVLREINDPRLRYLHQENRGVAAAANAGIRLSRGAYIARIDSDDLWLPELIETEMAVLDARPEVGVVSAKGEAMDRDGNRLPYSWGRAPRFPDEALHSLLHGDFVCNVTMIARRACIERAGLYDESLRVCEDWDLWLRVARHYQFAFVDRVLARVRRHEGNLTGRGSPFYESSLLGRTRVLDKVFGVLDQEQSKPLRHLKGIAYRNVFIEACLHFLGAADYRNAVEAFRRALGCGANPVTTSFRIVGSALVWYVIGRQACKRHVLRLRGWLMGKRDD